MERDGVGSARALGKMLRFWWLIAVTAALALPMASEGASRATAERSAPWATGAEANAPIFTQPVRASSFASAGQHNGPANHLPAARENIDVVSKLELQTPDEFKFDPESCELDADDRIVCDPDTGQPDIVPGQIADVGVYKNAAYLASWSEPSCQRGGFFSVDISNPASPQQLAFVPALPETYHGEGVHATTIRTPAFQGDVLAVNNEPCGLHGVGGFDLYDVSDPSDPQILVQGVGDQSPDRGSDPFADTTQDPAEVPNSAHSIFIWQDGPRAYAVIVDNTELADVDIFDITDPTAPEFITDVDLVLLGEEQGVDIVDNSANGDTIFHHDMVVKEIGGVQTMLVNYWDAGYVKLNVNDPANPQIIGDSAFDQQDPLVTDPETGEGFERPEGNGHQSEFSHDNQYVLAADEDFATYRTDFEILDGPAAGPYPSGEFSFTVPIATLPDKRLNGPVVYGGYGCTANDQIPDADTAIPPASLAADEEQIVVVQRGPVADPSHPYDACRFDEKLANAAAKGWDGVIIANHHNGSDAGASPDASFCGSGDPRPVTGMCIGHRALHLLFGEAPGYAVPYPPGHGPVPGTPGTGKVAATAQFDGWGYTHLYRNTPTDLETVDYFAIEEGLDERYASGFGDLSVHEFATDPTEYLAYSSYYSGGMRVLRFGPGGLEQTGKFIDQGGSNFWGVEQLTTSGGHRLFAGSDRDFGLYLFRYTGPGAAQRPGCSFGFAQTPRDTPVRVPLPCSDENGNPLTRRIVRMPANGTLSQLAGGSVLYTPRPGFTGFDAFLFVANDGAADSAPTLALVNVGPPAYGTPVVPDNQFTFKVGKYRRRSGRLIVAVRVRAPGRVAVGFRARLRRGGRLVRVARRTVTTTTAGRKRVVLRLSRTNRRRLNRAIRRRGRVRAQVTVSNRPVGGTKRIKKRRITLRGPIIRQLR